MNMIVLILRFLSAVILIPIFILIAIVVGTYMYVDHCFRVKRDKPHGWDFGIIGNIVYVFICLFYDVAGIDGPPISFN